jgi:hypothetical protein
MGKVISTIGSDIESVVGSVSSLVTDVASAVGQLTTIAAGFASPAVDQSKHFLNSSPYVISLGDPNDINTALKTAMLAAKAKASALFATTFPGIDAAGADYGVISGYVTTSGNVTCAAQQMTTDFGDWEISTDQTTIQGMANTIASQVSAQMGMAGTAQGHHSLNMNEKIDWVVAYGIFTMGDNSSGLVYAYTAALDSGFARAV